MVSAAETSREFWRRALQAGGATSVPRWAREPGTGAGEHEVVLAGDLTMRIHGLAGAARVPVEAILLAAHAKVVAALSGESDVVIGYRPSPGGPLLPCRMTTAAPSWRSLLAHAGEVAAQLHAHGEFPIEQLRQALGVAGPSFATEFDPFGSPADDPDGCTALRVIVGAAGGDDGALALRLRYRRDVVDAAAAGRIAGYHLRALRLMCADPDAAHARQSLLSAEETRFQLEGLAGPRRELPDLRAHELFERRVCADPEAIAAVHRGRRWSYRELNARANRLARALLARGLAREGVVAVVCERNLHWLAAVLAVFKAGGVYLPIEPHFPPARIAATLARAGCGLVLCDAGDAETLEVALRSLPQARAVVIETACAEGHDDDDLSALVQADQAAYIYFTSGSTGEPKGAMCEHAGMLNHLLAKIEDLEVREGEVVAQTAPQCFDISLWQLLAPLLVGGKTVLIEQEAILDVGRFLDELTMHRVGVAQVVPSYLEVVLAHLEAHPRPLPDLRCLSVTGEALKKELAARWFAAMPGVALVNAYGLTETSDDVTHEVMRTVPEYERVPLGRPVRNARVYIVDENLSPVPLGAPGEIVFAGVCVGRGYVNDPQRSASAFLADPHRPGQRLYRSGDFGRWLPDGRLEFLGRRDAQVKIRGFRIEIGEIENALLGVPGIRDGAVVVAERAAHGKHLVAFYTGAGPISPVALRRRLAETLPEYMVPSVLHWCEGLPLTANSKIDRKALTVLAGQLASGESTDQAPATEAERRLASAWAQVLGIAETEIGRGDDFFDLGGTSLSGVKLAIKLGRAVSLKDIVAHPVLAELAVVLQRNAEAAAAPAERALVSVDN